MKRISIALTFLLLNSMLFAQGNGPKKANFHSTITSMEYVTPMSSRPGDLTPSDNSVKEAKDKRAFGNQTPLPKNSNDVDDYFVKNRHPLEQSRALPQTRVVFDGFTSGSTPTDPSLAIGPNHVFVTFNTGFTIYDKSGNQLLPQTAPNPAIFPSGGCCDLTVSYDNAADRWVLTFLGNGAQVAVSDGPDPINSGWYVYNIPQINDYQKLSVWSDGYYITDNTGSADKVWALDRNAMLVGDLNAQIVSFDLPGLVDFGFYSPQALNVTDDNLPAAGGATIIYLQDDNWPGVSYDHIKFWTIDVDWNNAANSTVSAPTEFATTPYINVFDNGSFSNLSQPKGGGRASSVDALQATIMNQAQFRKFATHNSALFNFVVDTDASNGELAGVRWYEFRQSGDNQPWTLYQEGTYTAPDGRHAWHASLAMDGQGNIGMGYSSMSGPNTPTTVRIGSYYTGRLSTDPLGTMTGQEQLIATGSGNIPSTRYGDYSKIDVDPSDDATFWFINEYYNNGRKGVVGSFQVGGSGDTEAPTDPTNLVASNVTSNSADLSWDPSTDNVGVTQYNIFIDGNPAGTSTTTSFTVTGLSPNTFYNASVNAEDAAGITSGSATTSFTTQMGGGNGQIAAYYFETGLEGWTDGGNDCARQASINSFEGSYSIRLRDNSSTSFAESPALDLTGNTQVTIEFHTYANSMESGEDFFVELFDGSSYQVIGNYVSGTDFSNGSFFTDNIVLSSATSNFTTNNRIRIRCDASANNDQIWFDQVIISGDNASAAQAQRNSAAQQAKQLATSNNIKLYPNPAQNRVNIEVLEGSFDKAIIISATGQLIETIEAPQQMFRIDVSQYPQGMYFVRFVTGKLAVTKRFVKE